MKYRKMQQSKFGLPVTATGSTQKIENFPVVNALYSKMTFFANRYLRICLQTCKCVDKWISLNVFQESIQRRAISISPAFYLRESMCVFFQNVV